MNHLSIDNRSIYTFEDLKTLMDIFRNTEIEDHLFIDLIDNFVDGNIELFLRTIGEKDLAEKIKIIDTTNGDSQIRKELIDVICNEQSDIQISPKQFIEIVNATIKDNMALFEFKVVRKAVEQFDIGISAPFIQQAISKRVNITNYNIGEIISIYMHVPELYEEYTVYFTVDNNVVKEEIVSPNLCFYINGVNFKMIKVAEGKNGTFYIGETQVTQALWEALMGDDYPSSFKGLLRPVEQVSWYRCCYFVTELNKKLASQMPKDYFFALPTEAQWEYAAKGGHKSREYPFYDQYSGCRNVSELDKYAWFNKNANGKTHDVKTLKPNELGIYDMSGNVWEWCEDLYGSDSSRVLRGGSWNSSAGHCIVAYRNCNNPEYCGLSIGFRLALVKK